MFQYPYINLFILTLFSRTLIALSSSHWLIIWMALEINIISFIPIMSSSNWFQESEASLKYLLFQALGSSFILIRLLDRTFSLFPLLGLCIKLGLAPAHYWFPAAIKSLSWPAATLLITWQKLAPIFLLITSFNRFCTSLCLLGALNALVGGFGGLNQTHLRSLLSYSSIGHMGWMITTAAFAPTIRGFYLSVYIVISTPLIIAAFIGGIHSIKQPSKPHFFTVVWIVVPCILSLSGLPPFTGFLPKLISILSFSNFILPLVLLFGSLLNLSYYLNFFFSLFLSSHKKSFTNPVPRPPLPLSVLVCLSTFPLPLALRVPLLL